jgi:hypothetical protein
MFEFVFMQSGFFCCVRRMAFRKHTQNEVQNFIPILKIQKRTKSGPTDFLHLLTLGLGQNYGLLARTGLRLGLGSSCFVHTSQLSRKIAKQKKSTKIAEKSSQQSSL